MERRRPSKGQSRKFPQRCCCFVTDAFVVELRAVPYCILVMTDLIVFLVGRLEVGLKPSLTMAASSVVLNIVGHSRLIRTLFVNVV